MDERAAGVIGAARRRAPLAAILGVAVVAAWATLAGTALAAAPAVSISGFAFHPSSLKVHVGDTVTWTNGDGVGHSATADGGAFDTGTIAGGGSASVTFTTAGTFAYHCAIHRSMTASIVVAAASVSSPPPTDAIAPVPATPAGGSGTAPLALLAAAGLLGAALPARRLARRRA